MGLGQPINPMDLTQPNDIFSSWVGYHRSHRVKYDEIVPSLVQVAGLIQSVNLIIEYFLT